MIDAICYCQRNAIVPQKLENYHTEESIQKYEVVQSHRHISYKYVRSSMTNNHITEPFYHLASLTCQADGSPKKTVMIDDEDRFETFNHFASAWRSLILPRTKNCFARICPKSNHTLILFMSKITIDLAQLHFIKSSSDPSQQLLIINYQPTAS